jgi:hypothetical protein
MYIPVHFDKFGNSWKKRWLDISDVKVHSSCPKCFTSRSPHFFFPFSEKALKTFGEAQISVG